jgi:hypothetical protein
VLSKAIVGTSAFCLRYRYDPANRLIAVDEVTSPGTTRPLKVFQYARNNAGADQRAGKLVLSRRINWVMPVDPLPAAASLEFPATITQAWLEALDFGLDGSRRCVVVHPRRGSGTRSHPVD